MKIDDLTIEKVLETVNLMKQLRISRAIVEMAKELGVKRTELMKYINEHPKNINWDVCRTKRGDVAVVTGVFLDPHENPLTDEYADDRRKEHWIRLEGIWDSGWCYGFQLAENKEGHNPVLNKWENQPEDIEKFWQIPQVKGNEFTWGYAMGSHLSPYFHQSICAHDLNKAIEEGHKLGLRFCVVGRDTKEINNALDLGEWHLV